MARLIITNKEEYQKGLQSLNSKSGFAVSGLVESTFFFTNYKKLKVDNYNFCSFGSDFVASSGTLLYKGEIGQRAFSKIYEDYKAYGVKYVRNNIVGTYALAIKHDRSIDIFIDESGNFALYYYQHNSNYLITNLLYHIYNVTGTEVDKFTLIEELNEYCILDNRTYLVNTKRLLGNEVLFIDIKNHSLKVIAVEVNHYILPSNSFADIVECLAKTIKKYASLQFKIANKKVIFMTGGMDSRLTLAGDLASNFVPNLANWQGSPIYMNTKIEDQVICKKIAQSKDIKLKMIDVSEDNSRFIKKSQLEYIGEYATIYGNNRKWHEIFDNLSEVFYDFGYFGETVKGWTALEIVFYDGFNLKDYLKLYLGRQKHQYVDIGDEFWTIYGNTIRCKLEKICFDKGISINNLSKEDCMYLYFIYRTHADTKMVNYANIYGYSLNLYAQKELIDYINQTPYEYKREGKLNLALTQILCPELLDIPYFSHCHYLNFDKEKMVLEDPDLNSTITKIKKMLPNSAKHFIKGLLGKNTSEKEILKAVNLFKLKEVNVDWLPKVDENTYSSVGEYKSYFDYYTILNRNN